MVPSSVAARSAVNLPLSVVYACRATHAHLPVRLRAGLTRLDSCAGAGRRTAAAGCAAELQRCGLPCLSSTSRMPDVRQVRNSGSHGFLQAGGGSLSSAAATALLATMRSVSSRSSISDHPRIPRDSAHRGTSPARLTQPDRDRAYAAVPGKRYIGAQHDIRGDATPRDTTRAPRYRRDRSGLPWRRRGSAHRQAARAPSE